jgi:hypothetical protein
MAVKKAFDGADMTLLSVAAPDDRLAQLQRLRARLVEQIDVCGDERALCLLATRLQSVLAEIDELAPSAAVCAADMIAARRAKRRGKAS